MNPRIILVVPTLNLGGAERSAVKTAKLLAEAGFDVQLVVTQRGPHELSLTEAAGLPTVFLNGGSAANPLLWLTLRKVLLRYKPFAVIGWSLYANLMTLAAAWPRASWMTIISERLYFPMMVRRSSVPKLRRWLTGISVELLYKRASIISANSAANLTFLRRFIGSGPRYVVLPNFVDMAEVDSLAAEPSPWQGPISTLNLLAVGRLVHQKGFDVLLESMAIIKVKRPSWRLLILGDGPKRHSLQQQAAHLKLGEAVVFKSAVQNPFPYYKWAQIVVVPSRFEGFPNVALEAMACGRSVICADCRTGPRELTDGGRYGRLVPVEDPVALASEIIQIGDDHQLRNRLALDARRHVLTTYEKEPVTAAYLDLLHR